MRCSVLNRGWYRTIDKMFHNQKTTIKGTKTQSLNYFVYFQH